MAGAGKKTFTAGETLTASDVNTYLMEQSVMVFGGTAARSSAIPTPSEGMTSYRTDTQQIESYDGAEWRGMSGLQLIKKQTIGTGVSSVAVTDAYSATYSAYKIVIVGGVSSASATDLTIINTGSTSSYAYSLMYLPWGGSIQAITSLSTSNYPFAGHGSSNVLRLNCDVFNPFTATHTQFMANYVSGTVFGTSGCLHSVNTSYTGFTITPASGTLTGGTIYVYGYGA